MMITYYRKKIQENTTNTKKLWKVINNIIGKHKHSGSIISYITVDGVHKYDPNIIANEFGKFYSQLGSNLASQIKKSSKPIEEYLSKIPHLHWKLRKLPWHYLVRLALDMIKLVT